MENRQDFIVLWCWMCLRRCWAFHNAVIKQDSVINRENFAFHHMHLTSMYKHTSIRFTPMLDILWSYAQLLQPLEQSRAAATLWTSSRLNPNTQPPLLSPCPHSLPSPSQPLKLPCASHPTGGYGLKSWIPGRNLSWRPPCLCSLSQRENWKEGLKFGKNKSQGNHVAMIQIHTAPSPNSNASCPVIALNMYRKKKATERNKISIFFFFSTIHPHLSDSWTHACPAGFSDGHACKTSAQVTR